jgi:hypothetical protein
MRKLLLLSALGVVGFLVLSWPQPPHIAVRWLPCQLGMFCYGGAVFSGTEGGLIHVAAAFRNNFARMDETDTGNAMGSDG